jgi:hypothetical protein
MAGTVGPRPTHSLADAGMCWILRPAQALAILARRPAKPPIGVMMGGISVGYDPRLRLSFVKYHPRSPSM